MAKVQIKIHAFDEAKHRAREALPLLATIEVDEGPTLSTDEGMSAARSAVETHTHRKVRTISHVHPRGYVAIVSPAGG